jgi:hypothetical protein
MKCEEVDIKMIDYLDNNLDEQLRGEIERHVETCERCLDELKDTQLVLNTLAAGDMKKPSETLKINFYHMLHGEINKSENKLQHGEVKKLIPWYGMLKYRVAAGIAILICGTIIGLYFRMAVPGASASNEIRQLESEVSALKKMTILTMLKDGSSSERIQAVSYAEEFNKVDDNVIDVLVKTLNNDKNVNVRMAAAYALSKYADLRAVSDSLVKSLEIQSDPILQVTLINILAERREKSAVKPIQKIISNKSTMKEVRNVAENSLKVLI